MPIILSWKKNSPFAENLKKKNIPDRHVTKKKDGFYVIPAESN